MQDTPTLYYLVKQIFTKYISPRKVGNEVSNVLICMSRYNQVSWNGRHENIYGDDQKVAMTDNALAKSLKIPKG
jgi:hypothetical protein